MSHFVKYEEDIYISHKDFEEIAKTMKLLGADEQTLSQFLQELDDQCYEEDKSLGLMWKDMQSKVKWYNRWICLFREEEFKLFRCGMDHSVDSVAIHHRWWAQIGWWTFSPRLTKKDMTPK